MGKGCSCTEIMWTDDFIYTKLQYKRQLICGKKEGKGKKIVKRIRIRIDIINNITMIVKQSSQLVKLPEFESSLQTLHEFS